MAKSKQASKKKKEGNGNTQKSSRAMQRAGTAGTDIAHRENAPRTGSPFTFMRRFSEEMDRVFEDFGFGRGWLANCSGALSRWEFFAWATGGFWRGAFSRCSRS